MAKREAPLPIGQMDEDGSHWKKNTTIWIPKLDAEHEIRLERIRRDLDLERRAAADGRKNQPAKDDPTLNEPQLEICNRIFAGIQLLNQFLSAEISLAVERARQLLPRDLDVEHAKGRISQEISDVLTERRPQLVDLCYADLSCQRELKYFRVINGLNRKAHYKESLVLVFGILMTVFLGESILNGSLLAGIMSNGLIGGAALAAVISLINITLGVTAGLFGWRLIGHKKPLLRVAGVLVMVICQGAAISWNLLVAHFREVAEAFASADTFDFNMAKLSAATIEHIHLHGLLGVGSIQSWALLLLGVFIHFLAAKEGWDDIADRYLDYKKYDKLAKDAHAEYDEALATLRSDAREAVESIEAQFDAAAANAGQAYRTISSLYDLAVERRQEVRASEDEWVAGGTQLLKAYRDINIDVRDPGSAPAYFQSFPSPQDYRRRNFGAGLAPSDEIEAHTRTAEAALDELKSLREKARIFAENADEILKGVRKHINQTVRKLDDKIAEESAKADAAANKRLGGDGLPSPEVEDDEDLVGDAA